MQETENAIKTTSVRRAAVCSIDFIILSSIAFPHHEVQTTEHCGHVTYQATGQELWQDTEVNERWRSNFQPIRNTATSAIYVKAKLALGVFGSEINFAGRRIEPFGDHDEMVNQLFHLCHHPRFRRGHVFPVRNVDRTAGQLIDGLAQNSRALTHLFDSHQVTIVAIARGADDHLEIVLVVIEIRMFTAQIVFDSTSSQVWSRNRIRDCALLGNHSDVFCAIDKNLVPGQQPVAFVETRTKVVEKFIELWDKAFWKIADLPANSRVRGRKPRASQKFEEVIKLFTLSERVEKDRHRTEIERHRADSKEVRGNTRCFAANRADCFAARRNVPTHQFLNGERIGHIIR